MLKFWMLNLVVRKFTGWLQKVNLLALNN